MPPIWVVGAFDFQIVKALNIVEIDWDMRDEGRPSLFHGICRTSKIAVYIGQFSTELVFPQSDENPPILTKVPMLMVAKTFTFKVVLWAAGGLKNCHRTPSSSSWTTTA